ncbi:hypothetical protein CCAX7_009820 [Capsulimonas corticalis]|uniref:Uncharacterized protein n=1 Tax=Capsulimonas corticalis TaxID=2219043 RepID=A0A402CUD9_9BACT|nr:sigma-70 family RNA polymerase sigma factor [Capsulimonas corticalis]BDI28931.1 hypothetical protein CCAX7_009820 [Capsulimonas corticalis]
MNKDYKEDKRRPEGSIRKLIDRSVNGDRTSYDELVRRFQHMAIAYGCSIMSDRESAEDAAQEAFVEAFLHLDKLQDPAAFPGWFRTILFRQCHRILRRKKVETVPLEACTLVLEVLGPAHAVELNETRAEVRAAIANLAEPERLVVTLYYLSDYSVAEIASFLSLPTSTVKKRLQSARRKLRERILQLMPEVINHEKEERDRAFASRVADMLNAALLGQEQIVHDLLNADPAYANVTGEYDTTPLHNVVQSGNVKIAEALIAAGADVNAKYNRTGHTPLSWAITCGQDSSGVAEALVRGGAVLDLWCAAGLGKEDVVRSFWDAQGNIVDQPSYSGSSRYDSDGNPLPRPPSSTVDMISDALYICSRNGHIEVARWLLDHGADVRFKAFAAGTPLHWAYFSGVNALVELLIERGSDLNTLENFHNSTPREFGIIEASGLGLLARVTGMLDTGLAEANAWSSQTTALHEAARFGHLEITNVLLSHGANPLQTDANNKTALDLARERGHTPLIDLLAARQVSV